VAPIRREGGTETHGHLVPEDQGCEHLPATALDPLPDREYAREDLHSALAGDIAVSFAEFKRARRNTIQERGGAGITAGPAARQHGRTCPGRNEQTLAQVPHLRLFRPREHHAQRIEHHQRGVVPHGVRDIFPPGLSDKLR
jgi:hypothetical protein